MTLSEKWEELRSRNEAGLVAYLMAGHPTLDKSFEAIRTLAENGADFIEIGLPFSDPIADGPVIQEASNIGLANGADLDTVLGAARSMDGRVPLILMSYLNPLHRRGVNRSVRGLKAAGFAGLIIPDLPADEAGDWMAASRKAGLDLIFLAAPTSPPERLAKIAAASSGFVYCVSLTGTTGSRTAVAAGAEAFLRRMRGRTKKPLAVGFGVSTPEHVKRLSRVADGVIVGSRIVRAAAQGEDLAALVRSLKDATRRDAGPKVCGPRGGAR
ncbi:MAG: tryptophan synthase subunit alpha [bacterium]|nr:tryptophan synthase subunit alpha [bacterium]